MGLGTILPLVLLVTMGGTRGAVAVSSALIAFMALSTKLNVVIPGLAAPEMEGLRDACVGPGLSFQYIPTTMEWLVSLWIASVAGLLFLAVYRLAARPAEAPRVAGKPALQI